MQSKKTSVMSTAKCLGTYIWQINWQIYPLYWHLVVKNGNMTFLLLELIVADQLADLPPIECKASWDVYYGMYLAAIVDS